MTYDLQLFSNNAVSLLAAPISATATSLTVMTGYGSLFPQPTGPNQFFLITLEDQGATAREIVRVTGRSGDTFTGLIRAQEGTTARSWGASSGNDTLVDHRITAETMRLAMELPEIPPAPTPGITVQDQGAALATLGTTLNFVGAGVTATGSGATKTITIPGSVGGTAWINGAEVGPTIIDPGWTIAISTATYSQFNRGFKFFVTILMPANGDAETFEISANITGNISANAETVAWTRYGRVGKRFLGTISIALNTATKTISLRWQNGEALQVQASCTRIQHGI